VQSSRRPLWKKMWNPRWQLRNGCDGRLIAKILIMAIQVNLCCLIHTSLGFSTKFIWIAAIKIFAINLPSQPFLGRHLGFHIFFLLGGCTFFYSWAVFGLDFTSFCNCILQYGIFSLLVVVTCLLVFSTVADICSALHVYHEYFYLNLYIYIVLINDCRWIKVSTKQLNTCS